MLVSGIVVVVLLLPYNVISQTMFRITQETRFEGKVFQRKRTNEMMTCAHYCSMHPRCKSLNFKQSNRQERGLCELIRISADQEKQLHSPGWQSGQIIEQISPTSPPAIPPLKHKNVSATFTTLDGELYTGPTSTDGYKGTPLAGKVTLQNGIQIWKVPYTGLYSIEALGASGANGTNSSVGVGWRLGGRGARMKGHFQLEADTQLKILVGQEGGIVTNIMKQRPGGGGGGSFVTTKGNKILVIAGGGGGGAAIFPRGDCRDGDPGQSAENGTRHGGTGGNGGKRYDYNSGVKPSNMEGSGGGGFFTDGSSGIISQGGKSFLNGGTGGSSLAAAAHGGFGGGGSGTSYPGGGGGYSGGGVEGNGSLFAAAGGGGSYNSGTEQENEKGVNLGNGKVVIRFIK